MRDRRRTRTPHRATTATPPAWTDEAIRALGATTDVVTAGQILGLSRNTAYTLARTGTFPVPVIKAGAKYRVPVPALLAALRPDHVDHHGPPPTADNTGAADSPPT
ncbi:helix-turn-helix domain-containing protein [Dactylosporangium sp. NPDC005572]|uniref:helix-turn-helix domain-containing protein n=1 Tax=Dactylosporangium sp. NPDC005572 TaxID=3156889 RepID=UPI0033BD12F1